ncbi:16S rRNA (cytosine(1402)-N(4))-methyltransferase [Candidatus Woesebacteria bacterium CG22_combo_CG10-13_8_21_14_all_39_10]|uniref:Ribosomal RNA small subunit methyltransferase H n=2 Tax=Candidatus Woeseibacteriota TaxID=1752722 RepID=A0A2H0BJD1_9BACT|nr:MAG: 16S rRNA (cytosine(1402)-N(4))-methyltransferase [Candidatus Woesebacteria bacterium CG22_combo_CG10-13_8_21_14_all_39_10]PIZ50316.1 MAG: 16S rRNA (cytosine(1402)-N(4))-methyltransferase [Candidatus Woesebacteria bacterium CG_4_10_14_0_2_um_filter_39_14]
MGGEKLDPTEKKEFKHIPVLPKEVIEILKPHKGGVYVDGTIGGGGHSELIAKEAEGDVRIIGIDQDPEAIKAAEKKLSFLGERVTFVRDNFRNLNRILDELGVDYIDGILLDLGVSTYQLETPERGFSFSESEKDLNAPLDMRMDPSQALTAYDVVNTYEEGELRDILYKYGEEPFSRNIAGRIVFARKIKPIETTNELLGIVKSATSPKYRFSRKRGHYASKTFRAISIEVNQELAVLSEVIPQAVKRLKKGGRFVVISFYSGEDRIVKHSFREMANEEKPIVGLVTKKPVFATEEEIAINPKAASARLRAVERL